MAFMVSMASGYGRVMVRIPTANEALGEASNMLEHDGKDVRIRVSATGEEFTFDEFKAKMDKTSGLTLE